MEAYIAAARDRKQGGAERSFCTRLARAVVQRVRSERSYSKWCSSPFRVIKIRHRMGQIRRGSDRALPRRGSALLLDVRAGDGEVQDQDEDRHGEDNRRGAVPEVERRRGPAAC